MWTQSKATKFKWNGQLHGMAPSSRKTPFTFWRIKRQQYQQNQQTTEIRIITRASGNIESTKRAHSKRPFAPFNIAHYFQKIMLNNRHRRAHCLLPAAELMIIEWTNKSLRKRVSERVCGACARIILLLLKLSLNALSFSKSSFYIARTWTRCKQAWTMLNDATISRKEMNENIHILRDEMFTLRIGQINLSILNILHIDVDCL